MPAAPGIASLARHLPGIEARAKVGILPRKKKSKLSSNPTVSANQPGIGARPRHLPGIGALPSPRQGRDSSQEKNVEVVV